MSKVTETLSIYNDDGMTNHTDPTARSTRYVAGHGYYDSLDVFFAQRMLLPKASLLAEYIDRCCHEPGDRTRARRLHKADLAAMLADFDTATYDLDAQAAAEKV